MKVSVSLALTFICVLSSKPAFAEPPCFNGTKFNVTSEGPWPAYGHIKRDTTCRSWFTAGGIVTFKRLFRVENAQHGSVGLIEGGYFAYTSNRGYVGPDEFKLRICGMRQGKDLCTNLDFHMTVEP